MTFQTGHIGLNVSDLDASKDFYLKVFGFEVFGESGEADRRYAFLGLDGKLLLTLWQQSEGRFATGNPRTSSPVLPGGGHRGGPQGGEP